MPTKKDTAELEPILPQWLREARQQARAAVEEEDEAKGKEDQEVAEAPQEPSEKDEEELPDWLAGLDAQSEEEEELPDWLAAVGADIVSPEEETSPSEATEEPPAEETSESPPVFEGIQFQDEEAGELPEWLSDLQGESEEDEVFRFPTELIGEEAPSSAEEEMPSAPIESLAFEEEAHEEARAPAEEETPAWLSEGAGETGPGEKPAPGSEETLPDWLKAELTGEPTAPTDTQSAPAEEELPEWLRLHAEEETAPPSSETIAEGEELPDWLAAAATEGEQPSSVTGETPSVGEEKAAEVLFERVEGEEGVSPEEGISAEAGELPAGTGETPEWLAGLRESAFEPTEGEGSTTTEEEPLAPESAGELPDWLASLPTVDGGRIEPSGESRVAPFTTSPSQGESVPAFVEDEAEALGDVDEIFDVEMPDWLSALSAEREDTAEAEEVEELAPAELPEWVRAMRPVEAVVPEESGEGGETIVAERGPLAGIAGILPARPGIGPLSKPRAHALKLQVTRSQQASASFLDEMLQSETTSPSPPEAVSLRPSRLLRWFLALLLFLVLGLPILGGTALTPMPSLRMAGIDATNHLINELPEEAAVLVVFDYTPGLSGEVEATAAPVIDHLMLRGARLAFLSTTPLGPHLAERFFATAQADRAYVEGQEYVNLGYLAGETSGILSFATDPVSTVPQTVKGTPAWETPPLQGVRSLADFDAVFVLTGDADLGRAWIEQTDAYRGQTPMVLVISAQAEPLIRPYYEAGQVQGMVTGLYGGAYYERLNGRPGAGRRYLDAFGLGSLLAAIVMGLGGVWGLLLARTSRRRKNVSEEK
ncbi:MAG: hypothetical protein D6770_11330 [Anaerolineae bacterium]|nr:MAG: hypothetical protein D6770_11330 [Anaerolineae bacterium]